MILPTKIFRSSSNVICYVNEDPELQRKMNINSKQIFENMQQQLLTTTTYTCKHKQVQQRTWTKQVLPQIIKLLQIQYTIQIQ